MVGTNSRHGVVLALALLLTGASLLLASGCGGDAGAEETTTTVAAAPAPAPGEEGSALTPTFYEELVGSYVTLGDNTPQEFVDAVDTSQPIVVLFYVEGGDDDGRMRRIVSDMEAAYPEVTFFTYAHDEPDAYGDLATQLRIDYPPQMVFITRDGLVNDVLSGYADEGTVNQSISNLL